MPPRQMFRLVGLQETIKALDEMSKATQRNVVERAALDALEPFVDAARQAAPDDPETTGFDLHTSVTKGKKLSRRQQRGRRKVAPVEVFAGAGPFPQAHLSEFGSAHQPPTPWMRPAWDATKQLVLDRFTKALAEQIEKARKRAARKAARIASKAQKGT